MSNDWLIIGSPVSKRVELFRRALANTGQADAAFVSYDDLIAGRVHLAQIVTPGMIVRIESPDRDFATEKALLALGADLPDENGEIYDRCSRTTAENLDFEQGLILYPRQWFLGYREILRRIENQLAGSPQHRLINQPHDIITMFDKPVCHKLLQDNAITVPLAPPHLINSYNELIAWMSETRNNRVYVKLAHGSSASGVVAYQTNWREHLATTTVEIVEENGTLKLYNSRRLRTYRSQTEIARLIDALCRHRVQVERWIPKASVGDQIFDLRVMVIGGQAKHVVVRLSRSPLTNLHLSNERAGLDLILGSRLSQEAWDAARATCEQVMAVFSGSLYAGVDLAIANNFRSHAVLEVNAFGDMLYNTFYEDKDTYTHEIEAVV
jgi:hypothetical protein